MASIVFTNHHPSIKYATFVYTFTFKTSIMENIAVNKSVGNSNGVESASHYTLPEKVIQASYAFTQTLEMENLVFQKQINGIVQMTLDVMFRLLIMDKLSEETGTAHEEIDPLKMLASLKAQLAEYGNAFSDKPVSLPSLTAITPPGNKSEELLEAQLVDTVLLSYKNAAVAQQQMYTTMQAAATMTINTILNVDTVAATEPGTNHVLK
jgi:hypothetical protein